MSSASKKTHALGTGNSRLNHASVDLPHKTLSLAYFNTKLYQPSPIMNIKVELIYGT